MLIINCVITCQLAVWEEIEAPGENQRPSTEHWPTLFTRVHCENRTHDLWGERRLLRRLRHRIPFTTPRFNIEFYDQASHFKVLTLNLSHGTAYRPQNSDPVSTLKILDFRLQTFRYMINLVPRAMLVRGLGWHWLWGNGIFPGCDWFNVYQSCMPTKNRNL